MEKQIVLLSILVLLIFSCKKENNRDCVKSSGAEAIEFIDLTEYSIINIKGHINVKIEPNQNPIAEITGGENLLPLIRCEVLNDTLFIDNKNTCNWVRSYDRNINITLYLDTLNSIIVNSTGELISTDTIHNTGTFTLLGRVMNGETNLTLSVNRLIFNYINGTSAAHITGIASTTNYYCKSLGYIEASSLISNETTVKHCGTGELNIYCSSNLRGSINKSGNIYYSGSPKTINVEVLGSGQLLEK